MIQVALQPCPVTWRHFNPLCLPHGGEGIPKCDYDDYYLDNLIARYERECGALPDSGVSVEGSDQLTVYDWLFVRGVVLFPKPGHDFGCYGALLRSSEY